MMTYLLGLCVMSPLKAVFVSGCNITIFSLSLVVVTHITMRCISCFIIRKILTVYSLSHKLHVICCFSSTNHLKLMPYLFILLLFWWALSERFTLQVPNVSLKWVWHCTTNLWPTQCKMQYEKELTFSFQTCFEK